MLNRFYTDLCLKAITDNLTENEQSVLDKWLKKSDDNQKEFEQIKDLWYGITYNEQNNPAITDNVDAEWDKLNYRIMNEVKGSGFKSKWYESINQWLFKPLYKPAIAGIVIIILLLVHFIQLEDEHIPILSVSTNASEKKTVTLSDGSSILLNYSSNIQYPKEFSETREVKLNGEAFFSVTKNTKQFKVKTVNAIVTVLGTKFTIKTSEAKTDIFVKEGKVNLKQLNSKDNGIKISAGQKSIVVNNMLPSTPETVNADDALKWLNDVITFNRAPIYEIKSELEKLYGITIVIQKEEINDLTLTGSFKVETQIDSVLDMICLALDLKYAKLPNEYVINTK